MVVRAIFSYGILTPEILAARNKLFKESLCTSDKADWYPVIRVNSFNTKLPGTIAQNSKFIQLLSIMVYPELATNVNFVKSKYWKMFVLLKTLCQYFMAPKLSDHQIDIQTRILKEYLKLRLSLIDEDDAESCFRGLNLPSV